MLVAGAEVASMPLFDTRTPQQTVDDINTPMIVVDSSALLAIFEAEPDASRRDAAILLLRGAEESEKLIIHGCARETVNVTEYWEFSPHPMGESVPGYSWVSVSGPLAVRTQRSDPVSGMIGCPGAGAP
jgi:hypothetical protein